MTTLQHHPGQVVQNSVFRKNLRRMLVIGGVLLGLLLFTLRPVRADDEVGGDEEEDAGLHYMEWLLEDRVTPQGVMGSLLKAWQDAQYMPMNNANAFWESIGPAPLISSGGTRFGGRTNGIAIDPRDANVIYVGAALGGVWKTTDRGQSWTPLTDDQPSLAMGAIALDPVNPDIVYAGTGEENFSGDSYYGAGLLRSTDGGTTWTQMGADVFVLPNGGSAKMSRLLIDPNETATIYAATTFGLYKSTDSGNTWALKLSARGQPAVTDLIMHPNDPATLYAGVSVGTGTNKGIYRSTDAGETWELLDIGLTVAQTGRISVALAPSDPQILYASIGNAAGGAPQMFRLKSTDGGDTWQRLADCTTACNQTSYNNIIRVHPTNSDIVYQGAVNLYRTMNGGKTWANTTRGHTDHHWLVWDQLGSLYIGSDGGIFRINPNDSADSVNGNINTMQYYAGVALHPTNPNFILGGTQDNSSTKYSGDSAWLRVCGGDGAYNAVEGLDGDPDNVWYCSSQNLAIRKTLNNGQTTIAATNGLDRTGAAFIAPYIIDPNNSNVLITGTRGVWRTENATGVWERNSDPNLSASAAIRSLAFAPLNSDTTYYVGSTGRIWRTTDTGQTWTSVSDGLPNTTVTHIMVSPLDSNTVYTTLSGFTNGHIFRSSNGGMTWTNISGNLPNVPATALLVDFTGNTPVLYVGTDIGVFRSLDDGNQWEQFSTGLPTVRVEDLVYNPNTGVLVAATHGRGMWRLNFGS